MLAIFDIDGTVCDTQDVEGRCYAQALEEVCGFSIDTIEWSSFEEPTSSGIVRAILGDDPNRIAKECEVRDRFVGLLQEEQPKYPDDFSPINGAIDFVVNLSACDGVSVAFATGGFDTEVAFKLKCCGLDLSDFPHATSSDTPGRREIIPLAAKRSGFDLRTAVYFGDAPWDVKVANLLSLPMIGIGRRIDMLQQLGVRHAFRDFTQPDIVTKAFRSYL